MSLFQNRSFSNAMWQSTTHVSAFQELASRSRSGRIGEDKIHVQSRVNARRRRTADGMPGRFSGRNLPLSGQWTMPPTHAIDARHTLEKLQQTRSSVFFQNVAVVHRAHRALEKAEIASRTLDGALLLVVNFARASSWSVKIAAEQVLPEN